MTWSAKKISKTTLHIGLIGCGLWGLNILRDLLALGATSTIVDPSPQAQHAARKFSVEAFSTLDALPDVDGIIVATPASTHADIITRSLERGVPVFTEKPFTLDLSSAERLAQAAPDRLFVMHVWRYHPGIELLRNIIEAEEFGPIEWIRTVRTNWASPRTDVDSIWTMVPHDLSIALELLGHMPEPKVSVAEYVADDPTGMIAVLGDQPRFILETSTRYADKRREVRVHFRDAVLVLGGTDMGNLEIYSVDHSEPLVPQKETRVISARSALQRELQMFLNFLDGGPPPKSSMSDALTITSTMLRLRQMAGINDR